MSPGFSEARMNKSTYAQQIAKAKAHRQIQDTREGHGFATSPNRNLDRGSEGPYETLAHAQEGLLLTTRTP